MKQNTRTAKQNFQAASQGRNKNTVILHHVNGAVTVTNATLKVEWQDYWEVNRIILVTVGHDGQTNVHDFLVED